MITGFLGVGKTTVIRHLLKNNHGRRIAVVINEFGDVGIDRALLEGCGVAACADEDIVELANGCLCCTVADAFLPVMERLGSRDNPPDHIVIETSGLALPKPLVQAFQWPAIRSRVTVDGVVAVIDAAAVADGRFVDAPAWQMAQGPHDNPLAEVFADQLLCADMVALNKTDLVGVETLAVVIGDLSARLRAGVRLVSIRHGRIEPRLLLGLKAAAEENLSDRPSSHDGLGDHDHDDFESFALTLPAITDLDALEARLQAAMVDHDILRVKGFLNVPDKAMRLVVQGVGPRIQHYFDRPWHATESRCSRLVVIGLKGLDRPAIAAALGVPL
ncbi:MAG: cobalamin biosynthesis protein CobW [Rhodospirillaceae bacterium]|nr:MAG: cobalamin biosynthesis protein CobW [Rhodospirillaceae bacterium]